MAELPAVRRLSREIRAAGYDMLMINIHEGAGRDVLERFEFKYTPTFIVFNDVGEEVWRGNSIPTSRLINDSLTK